MLEGTTVSIPKKESLFVEFKTDKGKNGLSDSELVDAVVGMANAKGGVIYVGVEDNGRVTGVSEKHSDPAGVGAMIASRTFPSVAVISEINEDNGLPILTIKVSPSNAIISTSSGKTVYRRLKLDGTPENAPLFPSLFMTRLSSLRQFDFSSTPLLNASVDDLDPNERNRLRRMILVHNGDKSLLDLDDEELDFSLKLRVRTENNEVYPTVTGLLLIGKEEKLAAYIPTAITVFQSLVGTNVSKNETFIHPILRSFDELFERFQLLNQEHEFRYKMLRVPLPDYSADAFREAIVNAYSHRDYSLLQGVRFLIESDKITITSPGGFISGITADNLLTAEPWGRNPTLSMALKRIGLAELTGRGVDRIYLGSIEMGKIPPTYDESTSEYVRVVIFKSVPDIRFCRLLAMLRDQSGKELPFNTVYLLYSLREGPLNLRSLANKMGYSDSRALSIIEDSRRYGAIEEEDGLYRLKALDEEPQDQEARIIAYLAERGTINKQEAADLLSLSPRQAYTVLLQMVGQGRLVLARKGKYAAYKLSEKAL